MENNATSGESWAYLCGLMMPLLPELNLEHCVAFMDKRMPDTPAAAAVQAELDRRRQAAERS